jgi:uncharacterized Zn finger protein (UPF0148 family)
MFKERSTKKRITTTDHSKETTLDAKHQQVVSGLIDKYGRLDEYIKQCQLISEERNQWRKEISNMQNENLIDTLNYDAAWTSNLCLTDQLVDLERKIVELKSHKDEIEYYENTANILFEYYELIENQESQPSNTKHLTPIRPTKGKKKFLPVTSKTILEALNILDPERPTDLPSGEKSERNPNAQKPKDKSTLVDEYLASIDPTHVRRINNEVSGNCPICSVSLICLPQDGILVCTDCGYQETLLVEQNRPIYKQSSKEASHFSYKRINHLNEWISQIQGKESTDIPEDIFERILLEIKKENIMDPKRITHTKMREILKKLRLNKYYEHINYIINRINGQPTPHFPPEIEEKLRTMFKQIQPAFLKHCPKDRKNFLSYSYVLYKFFQLLGMDEYLRFFPLLKSREKIFAQEVIWKAICKELHWEFIPSV